MIVAVRRAETAADLDAAYAVRMQVFVDEQQVPPWEEVDEFDESALHFVAESGGVIVGTARLVERPDGTGKIGRVAVVKEARGIGAGKALMEAVIVEGFRRCHTLTLDAQLYVIPFYERLGFVAEGEVFLDAGIEHRRMVLRKPSADGQGVTSI